MSETISPYGGTTETIQPTLRSSKDRCTSWLCDIKTQLYITHALQAWGDRWWMFSIGLFLVILSPNPDSLRVTAINAIMVSVAIILFSHLIGYWIDLSKRLHVIRLSIFSQNLCSVLTCVIIYILLTYYLHEDNMNDSMVVVYLSFIISFSVLGRLASLANSIAISKDWTVVIANAGHFALTDVNATMRRIDMLCNIVAPVFIGFIMEIPGLKFTAIFVAAWNVVSGFVEYCLLVNIFISEPMLAHKQTASGHDIDAQKLDVLYNEEHCKLNARLSETPPNGKRPTDAPVSSKSYNLGASVTDQLRYNAANQRQPLSCSEDYSDSPIEAGESWLLERTTRFDYSNVVIREVKLEKAKSDESVCGVSCRRFLFFFCSFKDGFNVYNSYNVKYAGIALAMLYLTVLNFNAVTNGYMMLQGMNKVLISLTMAASSISGIVGTLLFPFLKNRMGISLSTITGSLLQISCITISVVSFFLPGSPWHVVSDSSSSGIPSTNTTSGTGVDDNQVEISEDHSYISVAVFACGVILSRAGLWMIDLGVTQLIQESVNEKERGRFSAFQQCLQSLFDLFYLILVIGLPSEDTYAWLGFVSYASVSSALFVLLYYCRKEGVNVFPCCVSRPNISVQIPTFQSSQHPAANLNGASSAAVPVTSVSLLVNDNHNSGVNHSTT